MKEKTFKEQTAVFEARGFKLRAEKLARLNKKRLILEDIIDWQQDKLAEIAKRIDKIAFEQQKDDRENLNQKLGE